MAFKLCSSTIYLFPLQKIVDHFLHYFPITEEGGLLTSKDSSPPDSLHTHIVSAVALSCRETLLSFTITDGHTVHHQHNKYRHAYETVTCIAVNFESLFLSNRMLGYNVMVYTFDRAQFIMPWCVLHNLLWFSVQLFNSSTNSGCEGYKRWSDLPPSFIPTLPYIYVFLFPVHQFSPLYRSLFGLLYRMPEAEWLIKNGRLSLTVLKAENPGAGRPCAWVQARPLFWVADAIFN